MEDVRILLTDDDYAKIADLFSARMNQSFTAIKVKETILNNPPNEFRNIVRYYIALKKLVEQSLKKICEPNSAVRATAFLANLEQAKNDIYNEYIGSLEYDSWETK